jgi:predicted acylesterase/phospholipase RssA
MGGELMPTGIAISGGGAKGDFQVGALRFLYDHGIRPDILAGVSVGAVAAARLASVAAPAGAVEKEAALRSLEAIWRSLRDSSDMWLEEEWYRRAQRTVQEALDFGAMLNPILPFLGERLIFAFAAHPTVVPDIVVLAQAGNAASLYNINPIAARLRDRSVFDPDRVRTSRISLRLGTVSLTTGNLRWVTETGALMERDGKTPVVGPPPRIPPGCQALADARDAAKAELVQAQADLKEAAAENLATASYRAAWEKAWTKHAKAEQALNECLASTPSPPAPVQTDLPTAVLASASIPTYFPPVRLALGDHYVDGGVRETVPIQAALDAGATEVYAICASGTGVKPDVAFTSPAYDRPRSIGLDARLVTLLSRTVDLFLDEVLVNDLEERRKWPEKGVFIIAPTIEVHDILTIEPGLIDIAMAYGYMRAWDVVVGKDRADAATLSSLTDQIIQERIEAWKTEFPVNGRRIAGYVSRRDSPLIPTPDPAALAQLRQSKRRLASLVGERLARGGAVPIDRDWWTEHWERHPWEPFPGSPWDQLVSGGRTAGPEAPPMSADAPAAATFPDDRVEVVGVGTDHALYRKTRTGSTWSSSWMRLGGDFTSAPAVCARGPALEVFGRGLDRQLLHGTWSDGTIVQGRWEPLGGGLRSRPSVVAWDPNRLHIFALGHDRQLVHKAWVSGIGWLPSQQDWDDLGGVLTTPPTVVAWAPDRLDIFALGLDAALYHKAWTGTAWAPSTSGWERLGGVLAHAPTAIARGPNLLDIFSVGLSGALLHKAWNGTAWKPSLEGWTDLGGVLTCPPAAVAWGPDRVDVFALGLGRGMFHKSWDRGTWAPSTTGWESLGGQFTSAPVAVSPGSERLDVFALGLGRGMFHKARADRAWRPSPTDWEALGGTFTE